MLLDSTLPSNKHFVYLVSLSSILMTWNLLPLLPPFRFSRPNDVGITAYLLLVSLWFSLSLPPSLLRPLFFADPAGAVVGKFFTSRFPRLNPAWLGAKTVLGSLSVAAVTYLTLPFPASASLRLAVSAAAAVAEAVGGEYDNLALGAAVLAGWRWSLMGEEDGGG